MFFMRHGESLANRKGLIVSHPANGLNDFGLTPEVGRRQVESSIEQMIDKMKGIEAIVSSDFQRTRETAEIAGNLLGVPIQLDIALRERNFGDFELTSNQNYHTVWAEDERDPAHKKWNVESVVDVAERMEDVVDRLATSHSGKCLIVSHGDPLQILFTRKMGRPVSQHRKMESLTTAQLMHLDL